MTKLTKGMEAPDFELVDGEGKTWRLKDLRGQKVIIYFYPADNTPGCTAQACDFRDSIEDFEISGYQVLGISPQGAKSHQRFTEKYELNFPLLVDKDFEAARSYGVTSETGAQFKGIPIRIKRSTFVIDEEGKLIEALYGVRARGHVEKLRTMLAS
ncbi:MAG: peroxiredoxin [Actinomycetota bacterium]|nr:peroxiredoxin [Actinomycetota bacterium]